MRFVFLKCLTRHVHAWEVALVSRFTLSFRYGGRGGEGGTSPGLRFRRPSACSHRMGVPCELGAESPTQNAAAYVLCLCVYLEYERRFIFGLQTARRVTHNMLRPCALSRFMHNVGHCRGDKRLYVIRCTAPVPQRAHACLAHKLACAGLSHAHVSAVSVPWCEHAPSVRAVHPAVADATRDGSSEGRRRVAPSLLCQRVAGLLLCNPAEC